MIEVDGDCKSIIVMFTLGGGGSANWLGLANSRLLAGPPPPTVFKFHKIDLSSDKIRSSF